MKRIGILIGIILMLCCSVIQADDQKTTPAQLRDNIIATQQFIRDQQNFKTALQKNIDQLTLMIGAAQKGLNDLIAEEKSGGAKATTQGVKK
jgi:hypothetical protein